ncbi:MAG TPA: YidC/Oxa1 family membrane protein insertase [Haloplasmataceae bacterium]
MKKKIMRVLFFGLSLVMLLNLSGCAKIYHDGNMNDIYPLNYNYVWDSIFVRPFAWLLDFFTSTTGSYALGILITTIVVRTILTPIYTRTNDVSAKMQSIQPEVQKIQAKYAGKTDPDSRNRMNYEIMQLYKENNVNMFAGCLMPFIQMPVFLAMFNAVVKVPVTFNYTKNTLLFLGFLDLSKPGPIYFLPLLVGVTAYILQKISMMGLDPAARNNSTMKTMTWLMPGMMFVFSFSQASALSLYWVFGNIYSTLQIIVFKKPFKKRDNNDKNVVKAKYREIKK